ncbi:MAG TPA: hypothetical protein PKD33_09470 [Rhodocyclaceae bacterium]|nr:hypothetical protein [Rhodocyclaceae bacterium]HNO88350.1 hypothetical protein [Rhodocyclaceae bacterium]
MPTPSLPCLAIGGDTRHGAGRPGTGTDPWWSALALGASGLATILHSVDGRLECAGPTGPDGVPSLSLDDFLWTFGQACPLAFLVPHETPLTHDQVQACARRLLGAALRHPPRLIVPATMLADVIATGFDTACSLNPYAEPSADDHQAWSSDSAAHRFPDLPFPGGRSDGAYLLVRRGRSGQFQPDVWLTTDADLDARAQQSAILLDDDFTDGAASRRWIFGYSNPVPESFILFGPPEAPAFIVDMPAGTGYSGGAAVLARALVTDFDARITFVSEDPAQGTTLELAALTIDPPRRSLVDRSHTADDKYRSLCFDVHGAPPYVSSECDENDGFRIGWNLAGALARIDDSVTASSNHYNRYGEDVGGPLKGPISGELRLVRCGEFWASYFRLGGESAWRCSGALHIPDLPRRIHLRAGAKHWVKDGRPAPRNRVSFTTATVLIPAWSQP